MGYFASLYYVDMASVTSTFTTDLTVVYNYPSASFSSTVPEPSFMAIGLTLVSGLVLVHRRRRAAQQSI
jgi:LPXTG-motif cell wall-anchored protein